MSENQNPTPVVPKDEYKIAFPNVISVRGQDVPVEKDPISGDQFVTHHDQKLGKVKLWLRGFTKGDKKGFKYFVPEYPSHQSLAERFSMDVVADMANAFLGNKVTQRVNATWNSKTNPKLVTDEQRRINIEAWRVKDFWLNTPEEALDAAPTEHGESMSGFQREQREIMGKIDDARKNNDFKTMQAAMLELVELGTRMQAFIQKQNEEYQEQLNAIENLRGSEAPSEV